MIPPMYSKASSNVDAVGYDKTNATLFIRYKSGLLYRYEGVPKETMDTILFADANQSVGKLVATMIKGKFSYSQACAKCGVSLANPHKCQEAAE